VLRSRYRRNDPPSYVLPMLLVRRRRSCATTDGGGAPTATPGEARGPSAVLRSCVQGKYPSSCVAEHGVNILHRRRGYTADGRGQDPESNGQTSVSYPAPFSYGTIRRKEVPDG